MGLLQARQILARGFRNRDLRQSLRGITQSKIMSSKAGQEPVNSECLPVEECRPLQVHRLVQILIEVLVKTLDIDAQLLQQTERFLAVVMRLFEGLGSAVADQQPLPIVEF